MADKSIFELNLQTTFASNDRLVVGNYANSDAEAITGQTLVNLLAASLDGHGGIQSIEKTSSSGSDPVVDVYTITMADETATTFTVTNGQKGDTGAQTYVYFRWAHTEPASWSDTTNQPDEWLGIYAGTATTPPTTVNSYTWVKVRGDKGETGDASSITTQNVSYQTSSSGTVAPSGSWTSTIPTVTPGNFLWTRTQLSFNDGSTVTSYSVARFGIDGTGSVSTVNGVSPDENGNIAISATNIPMVSNLSIEETVSDISDDVEEIQTKINAFKTIVVDASGSGDYTTISAAISAASDNDIILVQPGTYMETVHAYTKKVNIVGVDRKTCILQYSGLDYANPPLEMAKGSVKNLTINCLNSGTQGSSNAYCVHIDNDNEESQTLIFENVRFYNPVHQAVGIGLRHNFDLVFKNCEFEASGQAALYCHDWETANIGADKTGQKLTVLNCTLRNNSSTSATIMLQSQELATNCATCKFVGCSVYNANSSGSKISMTMWQGRTLTNNSFMGSSDWVLDSASGLNTVKDVNADPYPLSNKELLPMGIMAWTGFNSSKPLDLKISTNFGAFCVCMLQGVGLILLYVSHRTTNEVVVTNVVTGNSFSSQYTSITAPDYYTVRFTSTQAANSFVAAIAPNSLA